MTRVSCDVLIVGAGPSGTLAALLLEQMGVSTHLIERRTGPKPAPAAHAVNARTLEICRQAGVGAEALAGAALDPDESGQVYWVTKLGGDVLGNLQYEQQGDDQLAVTPTPLRNISQNRFEPILLDTLERLTGRAPAWGQQWEASAQTDTGVCSTVRDLGRDESYEVDSRYVIAADGASSRVRSALGIGVTGPEQLQSFVMMHLRSKALRTLPQIPPGVLFFVCEPATGGGVFVVHDPDAEVVYMHPFDPALESVDDYDAQRCAKIVREALEDPGLDFEVASVSTWTMTAQVADRYRDGRVFLVGDAAHRFPPTGGLGLNTGVQDAHNLAWKLHRVLADRAPEALLDSYESERRPVAQNNADQSLRNATRLVQVPAALGIRDRSAQSRERMQQTLATDAGRARVAEAIAAQAEHFDMPGLQLGFGYGPAADEGDADAVRTYRPSGAPGFRVPHAWLGAGPGEESLLDRLPIDRFTLLAGPDGSAWLDALDALPESVPGLRVDRALLPDLDAWLATAGIEPSGALLVRPDQHVAARWERALDGDVRKEIERALTL